MNWSLNGFDVRFSYDKTKLKPSDITTNDITTNETKYFTFEEEFKNKLIMEALIEENETPIADNIIRAVYSLKKDASLSEHIVEKEGYGKVVDTKKSVLLGKMSFQITAPEEEEFTTDWFSLVEDENHSPTTGIKINLDILTNYQKKTTFRFTKQFTGTVIGEVYAAPMAKLGKHKATVRAYKADKVKEIIDWNDVIAKGPEDKVHEQLLTLTPEGEVETNDDGTYELSLPSGTYDILIDTPGYLDQIYIEIQVEAGKTTDLGYVELLAGDINKDGRIEILDVIRLMSIYGNRKGDTNYKIECDLNRDEEVEILDKIVLMTNYAKERNIKRGNE